MYSLFKTDNAAILSAIDYLVAKVVRSIDISGFGSDLTSSDYQIVHGLQSKNSNEVAILVKGEESDGTRVSRGTYAEYTMVFVVSTKQKMHKLFGHDCYHSRSHRGSDNTPCRQYVEIASFLKNNDQYLIQVKCADGITRNLSKFGVHINTVVGC